MKALFLPVWAFLRVVGATMRKDLRSALTERSTLIQTITLPVNYLLFVALYVLAGSNAPTAVVFGESGPYAQAFYQEMNQSHSFSLRALSAQEAQSELQAGNLVAVVTLPADFDYALATNQPAQIQMQVNNLNADMTDDVRRAIRLSITSFYAQQFPGQVSIVMHEQDAYSHDLDYIPFLAMSILVICLMVSGLLQAGMAAAREWERETAKELLLAPVSAWALVVGKMVSAFLISLVSLLAVLAVVVFGVGDVPANPPLVLAVAALVLLVFVAAGVWLGTLLKDRMSLTTLSRAVVVPLFFVSGVFAPISFFPQTMQWLARLFPVHYAVVLTQYAFESFKTNTLGLLPNFALLGGFALLFLLLAQITLRTSKVVH